jgi:hypothetical protein
MYRKYHDGKKDRAKSFAAVLCDFEDITSSGLQTPPEYNKKVFDTICDPNRIASGDARWFGGFSSKEEAARIIDGGWVEGTERSSGVSLSLQGTIEAVESIRRRPRWGDEGDMLCTDRALRGDWDVAFQSTGLLRTNGTRIVTIVGAFGGNCNRTAEQLFWNGIQIAVVSDLLEAAGYQCEVIGMSNSFHSSDSVTGANCITAKRAGEPLRIDQIASIFAHAGVFRTFVFEMSTLLETKVNDSLGTSRGSVAEISASVRKLADIGVMNPDAVVIGEAFDEKSAIKNIRATLHAVTGSLPVAA